MAKTTRECPALGEMISSARCGEERGERIACPDDCAFNPFARRNYDTYFQLEQRVISKAMDRYHQSAGDRAFSQLTASLYDDDDKFQRRSGFVQRLFCQPMPNGRMLMDEWREARWAGLTKDERRVAEGLSGVRLALLELHRQIDETTLEVVDLLDVERMPFFLADRAVTELWMRFRTVLTWTYETPNYRRAHASVLLIQDAGNADPEQTISSIVTFLGGPPVLHEAREWMSLNLQPLMNSLDQTRVALRKKMLEQVDAKRGAATYRWSPGAGRRELSRQLHAAEGFELGDLLEGDIADGWRKRWDLVESGPPEAAPDGAPASNRPRPHTSERIVGQVLLGPLGAQVSAYGAGNYEEVKRRFEQVAGDSVALDTERIDDFAHQVLQRERLSYDEALVPPDLLNSAKTIEIASYREPAPDEEDEEEEDPVVRGIRTQFERYADVPVPLLENRTPRQAAADPEWRPRLIRLVKRLIHSADETLSGHGGDYDLNWLPEELGLHEIIFPPPPARLKESDRGPDAAPLDEDNENDWIFADPITEGGWEKLGSFRLPVTDEPAPVPSGRGLSLEEVAKRWNALAGKGTNFSESALSRLIWEWPEVLDMSAELKDELVGDRTEAFVVLLLLTAGVIHPRRPKKFRVNVNRWCGRLVDEESRLLDKWEASPDGPRPTVFSEDCSQPALASWIAWIVPNLLAEDAAGRKDAGAKDAQNPDTAHGVLIISALRAWIHELDRH